MGELEEYQKTFRFRDFMDNLPDNVLYYFETRDLVAFANFLEASIKLRNLKIEEADQIL